MHYVYPQSNIRMDMVSFTIKIFAIPFNFASQKKLPSIYHTIPSEESLNTKHPIKIHLGPTFTIIITKLHSNTPIYINSSPFILNLGLFFIWNSWPRTLAREGAEDDEAE